MANGWTPDGSVQEQINGSINDAIRLARAKAAIRARRDRLPGLWRRNSRSAAPGDAWRSHLCQLPIRARSGADIRRH